jgi:hypothetical protein
MPFVIFTDYRYVLYISLILSTILISQMSRQKRLISLESKLESLPILRGFVISTLGKIFVISTQA